MSRFEQYLICYEDRDELHTSRWLLEGISTKADGNTHRGWLFMNCARAGDNVIVALYKDPACGSSDAVATGTADISNIDAEPVKVTLSEQNSSGLSGSFYLEGYSSDPASPVPVLVSLCVDADLAEEWYDIDSLPADVYDPSYGMAAYCAAATRKVLLLVSQMYAQELGGYGGREHPYAGTARRERPDWRRIAVPDQLKDAAVCWALELAFGSCHKMASQTMYSQLRDRFEQRRKDAVAAWNLTFNIDPDSDLDADAMKSASAVRLRRV